jgi:plasmid stabilization system protein ParE
LIVYRSRSSGLDVLRILHGRRDARSELGEDEG